MNLIIFLLCIFFFFFFNDTATTEIYTLSLHDALPISGLPARRADPDHRGRRLSVRSRLSRRRSEEHTSELQSQSNLVCRLLLEKKKKEHDYLILSSHDVLSSFVDTHSYDATNSPLLFC